ncbi:MAG TPA: hypothetical protein VMH92_10790 [Acidocella sp.]|nr:hypothetical protein [Acidocella sp.]
MAIARTGNVNFLKMALSKQGPIIINALSPAEAQVIRRHPMIERGGIRFGRFNRNPLTSSLRGASTASHVRQAVPWKI